LTEIKQATLIVLPLGVADDDDLLVSRKHANSVGSRDDKEAAPSSSNVACRQSSPLATLQADAR
jgi:hypothetical protein